MTAKTPSVNCPNCKKTLAWTEANSYRPFCSKRCKLIDFGEWASERNSIAGEPVYPEVQEEPDQ
jgi:uncharacterized protein